MIDTNEPYTSWFEKLDEVSQSVREYFAHLTENQLNWKPSPEQWSIAQNLDHLIVINSTYLPILEEAKSGDLKLTWTSKVGFLVRFFGRAILKGVRVETTRKTKTMPLWEPSSSTIGYEIVDKFLQHQEVLKECFRSCHSEIEKGVIIPSPANRNINYRITDAFDIISEHEKRHVNHALSILNSLPD